MAKLIYSIVLINKDPESLSSILVGRKGVCGTDLYAESFKDTCAIVSNVDKNDLTTDRSRALEYAIVIEDLTHDFTLLPVRYGSILESSDAVIRVLEKNYSEIYQNLKKVENRLEFGLKIFCDPEKLRAELRTKINGEDEVAGALINNPGNSVYLDWMKTKLKEHKLEEKMLSYIDSVIKDISGISESLNAESKFKKMVTPTNIADGVILLEKDKKEFLIKSIKVLQEQYPGLHLMLTGPWPPYNFVDITMKG